MRVAMGIIGLGLVVAVLRCGAGTSEIGAYSATLAHCRDVGRDANSYAAYEACEKEAGL